MKQFSLGYRPEPPDEQDLCLSIPQYDLPKKVDWTEQVTGAKDQGNEGICAGFMGGGLKEFQEWKQHGKKFNFSVRWIYEWAKREDEFPGEDYEGTTIRGIMKALQKHGICLEEFWPYVPGEKGQPDEQAAENAYKYRIERYRSLTIPKKDIRLIKRGLHETGPVAAGVAVHSTWFDLGADGIIKKPCCFARILGYHAVLVVAYDDKYLKIKNSWGSSWGAEGFGFINFEYFIRILHSCWAAYDYN